MSRSKGCCRSRRAAWLLAAMFSTVLGACCSPPSPTRVLDPARVEWRRYEDPILQYAIDYPSEFEVSSREGEVLFRWGGVPVRVAFESEEEGRRRGLWFGQAPVRAATLGGRPAQVYAYEHREGPFCSRTVAFVVEHRGKFLGLEFRTPAALTRIQAHMRKSFRFTG